MHIFAKTNFAMENINIQTVSPDAITSVKFSGAFLDRINNLIIYSLNQMGTEKAAETMALINSSITNNTPIDNIDAYNLQTLLILSNAIESAFKLEGKITILNPDSENQKTTENQKDK